MKEKLLKGTLFLTIAGIITRVAGFLYRIFLANILGETELGIYQLIFPIYSICFTLYAAGLQTAVSQVVSNPTYKYPKKAAKICIGLSCLIAFFMSGILYASADIISIHFLFAPQTAKLLRILSLIFPFCGTTSMINGYFYGLREAKVPAVTQMIEQAFRIGFVFLIFHSKLFSFSGEIAVWGLIIGELSSNLYNLIQFKRSKPVTYGQKNPGTKKITGIIIEQAIPLCGTKLVISLLSSIESVLIPVMLTSYGLTQNSAFALYGVITGIVLPFILFPGTITNSLSVLLLPEISKADNENNRSGIIHTSQVTIKYSLLLGCVASVVFIRYGTDIGTLFFHSENAGKLLTLLAIICPFMYASTTLGSIINGLSKTHITFRNTVTGLLIRIIFLVIATPNFGIYGYILGLLISQIVISILDAWYLISNNYTQINLVKWLVYPFIILFSCTFFVQKLCNKICLSLQFEKGISMILSIILAMTLSFLIFIISGMIRKEEFN